MTDGPAAYLNARHVLAAKRGETFVWYESLDEARRDLDAAVILAGDFGGLIFVAAPVRDVFCDADALRILASDLDAVGLLCGCGTTEVTFERCPVGTALIAANRVAVI